jgi:hypothetical protein
MRKDTHNLQLINVAADGLRVEQEAFSCVTVTVVAVGYRERPALDRSLACAAALDVLASVILVVFREVASVLGRFAGTAHGLELIVPDLTLAYGPVSGSVAGYVITRAVLPPTYPMKYLPGRCVINGTWRIHGLRDFLPLPHIALASSSDGKSMLPDQTGLEIW